MDLGKLKNYGIINKNIRGRRISFLAGCIVNDELYFSAWNTNGFYKMNLNTGICIFLGIFEKETKGRYLHNQAIFFDEALWFIPTHGGKYIVKINIKTLEKKYIKLPENGKAIRNEKNELFWQFKCCYKDGSSEFWLVPLGYNMLLKVDMIADEAIEYGDIGNHITFEDGKINFSDACLADDEIWMCPCANERLVIFNIVTKEYKFVSWRNFKNNFPLIKKFKNWMIFLSRIKTKSILLVDKDTFEKKEISLNIVWKNDNELMYMAADIINQNLILAPFLANGLVAVDMETENVQFDIYFDNNRESMNCGSGKYQSSFLYGSKIVFASDIVGDPLMIYDTQLNIISYMEIRVDQKIFMKTINKLLQENKEEILRWLRNKGKLILEEEVPLPLYCLYQKSIEKEDYEKNERRTNGEKIFLNII